jgi:ferritin-like metal-binding protein YciE
VSQIIHRQALGINDGHDQIKSLRNQFAVINDVKDSDEKVSETTPVYDQGAVAEPTFERSAAEYQQPATIMAENEAFEEEVWVDEQEATGNSKLMEFFINELKDLLWAEQELVDILPEMAEAATSAELKMAFESHLVETETHVTRLEQIFGVLGLEPDARKCHAMAGIVEEGDEIISATEEGTAQRDVGLIFAGQKAEHYEIASYGGMISLAKTLGYYEIAETLVLTLDEEKAADALLTEIAENSANYTASTEQAED